MTQHSLTYPAATKCQAVRARSDSGRVIACCGKFGRLASPLLTCLLLTCLLLPGCSDDPNANNAQAQSEKDKEKEAEKKKKPDYELTAPLPVFSQGFVETDQGRPLPLAKPGHWVGTVQQVRANYNDLNGRITHTPVDRKEQEPLSLVDTPYVMESTRPAVMAKNRPKRIEGELFLPTGSAKVSIRSELQRTSGAPLMPERSDPWTLMPSYQYYFLVLAKEPARYTYLKVSDTVRAPWQDYVQGDREAVHYRVVLADADKRLPISSNSLTWTSVAYVLWDDVNLERFNTQQQAALLDWLHWGGRLIVNGPNSLETLRSSFLAPYLPVATGTARKIDALDLAAISEFWGQRAAGSNLPRIAPAQPWSGIQLKLTDGSRFVPNTGDLLAERSVGLGSLVVSSMQLDERELLNWPGFDGFLNGALLHREPRRFMLEQEAEADLRSTWANAAKRRLDAHFITPLRWFARDAGTAANVQQIDLEETDPIALINSTGSIATQRAEPDRPGGIGSWNDISPVSEAARDALRVAAGVRVPAATFVVGWLAVYLAVLVPLNWMIFRALGKVEWAWAAAPLIALLGTLAIVKQAQLDIGFVRARTEIAFLELHNDYDRGHLSRYSALYASLSTSYDMQFDSLTAVSKPLPQPEYDADNRYDNRGEMLSFEKYDDATLRGLQITSSSTQLVHSEQMKQFEGTLKLAKASTGIPQVTNRLGFTLKDVVVVWRHFDSRSGREKFDACWLDELRTDEARALPWQPITLLKDKLPFADKRQQAAELEAEERMQTDKLLALAFQFPKNSDPHHAGREELRLVGRYDQLIEGSTVTPQPSQSRGSTVVLAHLGYGPPKGKQPDTNSPADVLPSKRTSGRLELP